MLMRPTHEKLEALQLRGMIAALEDQARTPEIESMSFEERLGLLLDREETSREGIWDFYPYPPPVGGV